MATQYSMTYQVIWH